MTPASTQHLYERFYWSRPGFVDGTKAFHEMCRAHLAGARDILEIGAGPANPTSKFLTTLGRVVGVDVSEEIQANDAMAERYVFDGGRLPFGDRSFDGVVSNYVLEHVADPDLHFAEVARVLRPGGRYLFRTPNLLHYVAAISRFLPHAAHVVASKRLRGMNREDHDPYPTHYRANSCRTLKRLASAAGLRVIELRMVEKEPSYGRLSPLLFFPMMAYERVVNRSELGAPFRSNVFGVLERTA